MITNFKIFEENTEAFNNKFWYINGDENTCNMILKKFKRKFKIDTQYIFKNIESDKPISGVYFGKIPTSIKNFYHWKYFAITDTSNEKIFNIFNSLGCKFEGELKLKNDKLFIDTLMVDTNKYNI